MVTIDTDFQILYKDITTVTRGVIAHGVNAQRTMGSGVALAIKTKWPAIYSKYMLRESVILGMADIIDVDPGTDSLYVANCYTQQFYGSNGRFADLDAVRKSVNQVLEFADSLDLPVYLPQIGCGLGGLDWDTEVAPMLSALSNQYPRVDVFVCVI